jgi:tRNA(Ile)-lysidine synthase
VSPRPWGSHTAEGFRKSDSLDRIVSCLFDEVSGAPNHASKGRVAFSAGSHVLWTPVYVRPDGQIKHVKPNSGTDEWNEGWLASRSPPYRTAGGPAELEVDVTSLILNQRPSTDPVEILFDNRFLLTFDLPAIPEEIFSRFSTGDRLVATPTKKYFLPQLVFRPSDEDVIEDPAISDTGPTTQPVTDLFAGHGRFSGTDWADWRHIRAFG